MSGFQFLWFLGFQVSLVFGVFRFLWFSGFQVSLVFGFSGFSGFRVFRFFGTLGFSDGTLNIAKTYLSRFDKDLLELLRKY